MYSIRFTADAESDFARLDRVIKERVLKKLRWLAENFNALTPEALTGEWQGVFKLRTGDHRILYTVDRKSQTILIHFIRHRREVYRTD